MSVLHTVLSIWYRFLLRCRVTNAQIHAQSLFLVFCSYFFALWPFFFLLDDDQSKWIGIKWKRWKFCTVSQERPHILATHIEEHKCDIMSCIYRFSVHTHTNTSTHRHSNRCCNWIINGFSYIWYEINRTKCIQITFARRFVKWSSYNKQNRRRPTPPPIHFASDVCLFSSLFSFFLFVITKYVIHIKMCESLKSKNAHAFGARSNRIGAANQILTMWSFLTNSDLISKSGL